MNNKTILSLFIALLLILAIGAVLVMRDIDLKKDDNQDKKQTKKNIFRSEVIVKKGNDRFFKKDFKDFNNIKKFQGKIAAVNFTTGTYSWNVSSTIRETTKKGPTFAGNYAVSTWVCGKECQRSSIVNVASGEIIVDGIRSVYGVDYRINSSLFVVNPPKNVPQSDSEVKENVSTQYYELKEGELDFIGKNSLTKEKQTSCAQVVTKAKNESTGEVLNFPTPCAVPEYGWKEIN
ncbi:MAG: hypothetical protein ABEJ24_05050 [Candidatus Magasanikbacteria bacterium]